jgi:hypothetical protein
MSRPLSASRNPPARLPCPSGPGPTLPAAAAEGFAVVGSGPGPASGDCGADVPAVAGTGTAPVAGGVGVPWLAEGAGPGVGGAASCPGTWL